MGENYVLGNRADENEFKPYKLDPRMFEENKVIMMALGTQHAVALAHDAPGSKVPELKLAAEAPAQSGKQPPVLSKQATPAKIAPKVASQAAAEPGSQQQEQAVAEPVAEPENPSQNSKKRTREEFEAGLDENIEEKERSAKKMKVEDLDGQGEEVVAQAEEEPKAEVAIAEPVEVKEAE